MMTAAEDAGWIIHPTMFLWLNGQGQAKGNRVDLKADKLLGNERPVIGTAEQQGAKYRLTADSIDNGGYNDPERTEYALTGAGSEFTEKWVGWFYGLGTLAPRVEPVMIAQVPFSDSQIENIVEYGTGSYNIDGTRIGPGRFPSNLAMVHHPDCVHVGTKRVKNTSGDMARDLECNKNPNGIYNAIPCAGFKSYGDEDGYETIDNWQCVEGCPVRTLESQSPDVARYTKQADWSFEIVEQMLADERAGVGYSPKVSQTEREAGMIGNYPCMVCGGIHTETHTIAGREEACRRNSHKTLKPIKLIHWLSTMLSLPNIPDRYPNRHLYIPFAGVASEMIASLFAGWDMITGVQLEPEHVDIARWRLRYWQGAIKAGFTMDGVFDRAYESYRQTQDAGQLSLL